jgi:hypothetical protein
MTVTVASNRAVVHDAPLYPPSWLDRLTHTVESLPGPPWVYYLAAGVLCCAIGIVIRWSEGEFPEGNAWLFYVVAFSSTAYYLGVAHYLDRFAGHIFARFRSAFALDATAADALCYRLTTLPARRTWIVSAAGAVYGLATVWGMSQGYFLASMDPLASPFSAVYETLISVVVSVALFVFFYHTVHQLRTISLILATSPVSLFQQGPLFLFSRLTARTAVAWIAAAYVWAATEPDALTDPLTMGTTAVIVGIGLMAFVWPLWGVHRILVDQKTRAVDAATQRLATTLVELHRRLDDACYDDATPTAQAVTALHQELAFLEKTPTWPWRPETVRGVLTALILPVVLWFITSVLERVLAL